jgi:hypothetical protein
MPYPSPGLYPSSALFPSPGSGSFTAAILPSLAPWNDPGGAWITLNGALAEMFEQTYAIVQDVGTPDQPASYTAGWSTLLDPDVCPTQFLPYLATFVGANVPPGTDDTNARALIKGEAGLSRGTPGAMVAAATRNLTGTRSVAMLERTPDAYSVLMVMRPDECQNLSAVQQAVGLVKPAGIVVTYVLVNSWTIFQMESAYATIALLEAAFLTVRGLENNQTGH